MCLRKTKGMRIETLLQVLVALTTITVVKGHGWDVNGDRWQGGSAYATERIPEMRTFIGQCRADVGRCPIGSCSNKPFNICPQDGYICPETETREITCEFGVQKYEYVKRCVCCKDNGISLQGIVLDAVSNAPLENMIIRLKKGNRFNTNADGTFESTIPSSVRSIIINAEDKDRNYMDAVRVVDIAEGFRGPVKVKLFMVMKASPVKIDSNETTKLYLSDDQLKPLSGNTVIEIQANSFTDRLGRPYNGQVDACVTFIDTMTVSEDIIPGRFLTRERNILEPLITDGIFSLNFKSAEGEQLKLSEPVKFNLRKRMQVWKLNTKTGLWTPAFSRRQVSKDIISIESDRWYIIDKTPVAPRCFFKGRIFNQSSGIEIKTCNTASFKPHITAYTYLGQRLTLYVGYTNTPSDSCYEVRCPVVSNSNNSFAGFINMSSTEVISIGGIQLPYVTYLSPKEFNDYDAAIQPTLSDVQFTIAPNGLEIYVNFVSRTVGPFYSDKHECEASTLSQAAFHFFKPDPPSYLPVQSDAEICTARVAFKERWHFYSYTSTEVNMPNVTGTSVWQHDGSDFYYKDIAQMEHVTVGNKSLVFICLNYRCSQENEATTVYLDIDIPTFNYTYNLTHPNGTLISFTHSIPKFFCKGKHADGSVINNDRGNDKIFTVKGSFVAPEIVGSGPDFYDTETNDCRQETELETFAYVFTCYRREAALLG